jgi:hypothetical protein
MKRWLAVLACALLLGGLFNSLPAVQAQDEPPVTEAAGIPADLQAAFDSALAQLPAEQSLLPYEAFIDNVVYSQDGTSAVLWLGFRDAATGEVIAGEPGLALARLDGTAADSPLASSGWTVTLPTSKAWADAFAALPGELVSPELEMLAGVNQPEAPQTSKVFSGYLLPWAGGKSVHLSGSIWHVWGVGASCPTACRWAFDFADGTMFPLLAAKGGSILGAYDGCPNGSTSCTNSITIKDTSTTPVTYQIYLHLAQNSIPAALKVVGAPVLQGQYIGNVDDTGYSSGHHLHFHVTDSVYWSNSGYYWGNSVDITFDDVAVNGGRPRTCNETTWDVPDPYDQCVEGDWYVSGNHGANPPSAQLTLPAPGEVVTDGSLLVAGTASDDLGVTKAQAIVKIDGAWVPAGSPQTLSGATYESYIMDVSLCDAGAPAGPLDVAVRVWDYEGNASPDPQSARGVINNTACAPKPPACQPGSTQVALYSGPNYTGACKLLGAGTYESASKFSPLPDNTLSSLLVGGSVQALLYEQNNLTGRSETILQNDPNLADNRFGADRLSSIRVAARTLEIAAPVLNAPFNITTAAVTSADSLVLDWAAPGAVSFQSTLTGPIALSQGWTDTNGWSVGSLPAGDYAWTVKAKTANGAEVSNSLNFTVADAGLPAAPELAVPELAVPAEQMEDAGGWTATSAGLWRAVSNYALGGRSLNGWLYSDPNDGDIGSSTVGASDLTSPPFTVPAAPSWLAFDYNTQTESDTPYWDQRWVQISVNGGRFENLRQLHGERMDAWLSSPWIDLSAYAGQSVRLRFHFDIVDKYFNGGVRGWAIDNVRVFTGGLPGCAETGNDTPGTATAISVGATAQGGICPAGDTDFYAFSAAAGQYIGAALSANGTPLELALLGSDGRSLLQSSPQSVGLVTYAAGTYYLRVRAADHPGVGGEADTYSLRLISDSQPPSLALTAPAGVWLPGSSATIAAQAGDSGSGVARVDFLWHSADWTNDSWQVLGSDADGADGWSLGINPAGLSNFDGSALAAQAFDFAGNSYTAARFGLRVDASAPVTQLQSLPASTQSTAVLLQWSGSDAGVGLDHFELQYALNGGAWQTASSALPADARAYWFVGQAGGNYAFRMRAVDKAGNAEAWPGAAEAATTLAASCTGDAFEKDDDTSAGAVGVTLGAAAQERSLCGLNDPDWVKFTATAGQELAVMVNSLSGGAAVKLSLYAPGNTTTPIATAQSGGVGLGALLRWKIATAGEYRLKIEPLRADLWGTQALYATWIGEPKTIFLPVVGRN